MHIYANIAFLGLAGLVFMVLLSLRIFPPSISLILSTFFYSTFLLIAFINVKIWLEKKHHGKIKFMKEKYERKIRRLKNDHDTAMLEKTIREGSKTLIKNSVDYFKLENIQKEMPPSAAIQNLQLDKYGQIIELLADFSLILPDYDENKQIVLQEINHQIDIFEEDEKHFADFLRSILGKYLLTLKKKMREKIQQSQSSMSLKSKLCPACSESVPYDSGRCKYCGYDFSDLEDNFTPEKYWIKQGYEYYRQGNFEEAIRHLTFAINLNPEAASAYYSRGMLLKKMDNPQKAIADFEIACRLGHQGAYQKLKIMKLVVDENPEKIS